MVSLMNLKQRGLEFFKSNYTDLSRMSNNYKELW